MATTDNQTDTSLALAPDDDTQREPRATADDHSEAKPKKTREKPASHHIPWILRVPRKVTVKLSVFWDDLPFLEDYFKGWIETTGDQRPNVEAEFFQYVRGLLEKDQKRVSKARANDHSEAEPRKHRSKSPDPTLPKIFWYRWTGSLKTVELRMDPMERTFLDGYIKAMIETAPKNAAAAPYPRPLIEARIIRLACRSLKKDPSFLEWKKSQNQGGNEKT